MLLHSHVMMPNDCFGQRNSAAPPIILSCLRPQRKNAPPNSPPLSTPTPPSLTPPPSPARPTQPLTEVGVKFKLSCYCSSRDGVQASKLSMNISFSDDIKSQWLLHPQGRKHNLPSALWAIIPRGSCGQQWLRPRESSGDLTPQFRDLKLAEPNQGGSGSYITFTVLSDKAFFFKCIYKISDLWPLVSPVQIFCQHLSFL